MTLDRIMASTEVALGANYVKLTEARPTVGDAKNVPNDSTFPHHKISIRRSTLLSQLYPKTEPPHLFLSELCSSTRPPLQQLSLCLSLILDINFSA